tara:strand:+ start:188 stop:739 length:552 start_codon:yes stop_codon:yes gene_type:complete
MKSQKMLNQIKALLNLEVKLEQMKLDNGTVIESDAFDSGNEVFILTEDEKVALPVGEYILEDSRVLMIKEEGMIDSIEDAKDEEVTSDLAEFDPSQFVSVDDWKGMEERIANLEDAIAKLKEGKMEMEKVEEELEEVKEKLSAEPAAKAIKHNPEAIASKQQFTFGQNKPMSTKDIVFSKLFK